MNSNDFVNIDSIIAEATSVLDDMEFSHGHSKGRYTSWVRDAMDELAYETFYQKLTKDLDVDKKRLAVDMPTNCFNIKEMYLHNGICDSSSKIVYWKRQYNNTGSGRGHTAKIKEGQSNYSDPFYPSAQGTKGCSNLCYANIQNGLIMLSSDAVAFTKLRIIYNGTFGDVTDVPMIPRFFKRAVMDYIEERFYASMKAKNPRLWRGSWTDAFQKLNSQTGSWKKARVRASSMDSWEKESLEQYLSNLTHK